uniref:ZF-HD dimerization-type domain-containing protein n=1 Tax=Oryza rufipogon TaxID=4529 RepID=A0A0E0RD50_ORYRU
MASGADGTAAALLCAACGCHRSFHRREVEAAAAECDCSSDTSSGTGRRAVISVSDCHCRNHNLTN